MAEPFDLKVYQEVLAILQSIDMKYKMSDANFKEVLRAIRNKQLLDRPLPPNFKEKAGYVVTSAERILEKINEWESLSEMFPEESHKALEDFMMQAKRTIPVISLGREKGKKEILQIEIGPLNSIVDYEDFAEATIMVLSNLGIKGTPPPSEEEIEDDLEGMDEDLVDFVKDILNVKKTKAPKVEPINIVERLKKVMSQVPQEHKEDVEHAIDMFFLKLSKSEFRVDSPRIRVFRKGFRLASKYQGGFIGIPWGQTVYILAETEKSAWDKLYRLILRPWELYLKKDFKIKK